MAQVSGGLVTGNYARLTMFYLRDDVVDGRSAKKRTESGEGKTPSVRACPSVCPRTAARLAAPRS